MSRGVPRPIRAIAGVIALVVIFAVVSGWLRDYRGEAPRDDGAAEATVTPDATGEAPEPEPSDDATEPEPDEAGQGTVVVIIEGLNFRREPVQNGALIRGLGRNDRLTYLDTVDGWYHVRDASGVEGYVSANPQYTELRE